MTYGSFSIGHKAGGFNKGNFPPFGQEKSFGYEIGLKGHGFDRRVDFGGSLFLTKLDDQQVTELDTQTITEFVTNQGKAKIYGFELELGARPLEELSLRASATALNAEYTDYTTTAISPDTNN